MKKKILIIIFAFFSYLQAMDLETPDIKTFILQGQACEATFFELFKKMQIKPPYRFLEESEIYSYESPETYSCKVVKIPLKDDSKKIKETQIIRPHTNQTIFIGSSLTLVLYVRTQDKEQTIYINPDKFFRSAETITLCTAFIFAQKEKFIMPSNSGISVEMSLSEIFEKVKTKLGIETIKKYYIKTPITTNKQCFGIILKQQPDESYLLLHDEQTLYFNQP